MAQVSANLALPEGSSIPEELSLVLGSPVFTGTGLLMPRGDIYQLNMVNAASDGTTKIVLEKESNKSSYVLTKYRYQDDNNHWLVSYSATSGVLRAGKVVAGVKTFFINTVISSTVRWNGGPVTIEIVANGDSHEVFVYHVGSTRLSHGSTTDSFLSSQEGSNLYTDTGDYELRSFEFNENSATSVEPIPDIQSVFIDGFKRQATKLGIAANTHSQIVADGNQKEYWPWPIHGSEIPNWPHEEYPMLLYTSPDHGTNIGGIYLRVWEKALGDLVIEENGVKVFNQSALVEWQDVSSRSEFSHISKKTNPIFVSPSNGTQTETPTVTVVDGVVQLFWHNYGVNLSSVGVTGKSCQTTKRATGTNGVDFTGNSFSTFWYDPYLIEGEGHNGYAIIERNVIESFPYSWIAKALHGGGSGALGGTQAIYGSNDGINFYRITIVSDIYGILRDKPDFASNRVLHLINLGQLRKEGAYYRASVHYRLAVGGTTSNEGDIHEVLLNENFNVVSYSVPTVERGTGSDFDAEQVGSCIREFTYEGQTIGFYAATSSSSDYAIGAYLIEDTPHTWEVFHTLAEKQELLNETTPDNGTIGGLTYSHTPSFADESPSGSIQNGNLTVLPLPMDGTPSTAISSVSVTPADHDVIDIKFDRIGKNGIELQMLEFGLIDSLSSTTARIAYEWPIAPSEGSPAQPMEIAIDGAIDETNRVTSNYFGQDNSWQAAGYPEDESSKHMVGIRIIPSLNKIVTLEGVALCDTFDIEGFDFTKELKIYTRGYFSAAEEADGSYAFGGLSIETYSNNAIAVPSAPTLTTSKSSDSVTLSTNNVSGATGYKYFLDNQSNETGVFENLEPETEYTVYARAVNSLGDSEPSTIQTVTTDAAQQVNQPPVANAGPDQSVAAGVLVQVSASGSSDGDGTIVGYKWRETTNSGITLSNTTAEDISFTSPVSGTAQTVTLELIVTDDDGVDSAPVYVDIDVAAEVDTTPPVIILTGGNIALNVGEVFQEPGYQAFNNKGADITDQVTVTGSTSTAFPRTGTLEYNVVVDGIAAETQTRIFTVTAESELLEAVSKQKFLRDNTVISAFTGRSNIEELKFQLASTNTKIALDNQGYYDFDENETQKIIVVTEDGEISSENGDVEWKGSSLFVRFGAISSRKSQLSARVVVFLAGDERGLVIAGPGLNANLLVKFN